ncbi:M48 family metalloprotease [Pleionea sp. CnH1-48]|uniref:M48 family metalloprotease n=1 Tax=Pleionea sp. CnH1-48 TaxID=2954494 RepID=UPI00209682AE|nr:M48 family metalloprotease [Pleionea sp. CnH1-48]MCO7225501.1 M48 family metalloprotease [Pleionea sp. CnH1-48]
MKKLFILCLSLILVGCSGLVIQGINVGRVADIGKKVLTSGDVSYEEEQNIGAQMTAVILGGASLHKNESVQQYVNRVGRWVALQSERPDIFWQFGVVDSPSINAFAMPGGYILVTTELLQTLSSEAELAAVLAHEIAHINERHHLVAMEKSNQLSLVGDVAMLAGDVYQAKNPGSANSDFYKNRAIAKQLINTTHNLYTKGLSKDDEYKADASAVVLLVRAGYDPYALVSVLQKLDQLNPDDSALQMLFNSHPKPVERLDAVSHIYDGLNEETGLSLPQRFYDIVM